MQLQLPKSINFLVALHLTGKQPWICTVSAIFINSYFHESYSLKI